MRISAYAVCLTLMQGYTFWCTPALGQGFTRRYDPVGTGEPQVAWAIEQHPQGYIILGATYVLLQNNDYYLTSLSMILDHAGEVVASDTVIVQDNDLSPGAWNAMSRRAVGGYVAGGSTLVEDDTKQFALIKVNEAGLISFIAQYGTQGEEWIGRQAIECKDGGFLMVGETGEFGVIDAMLIKTDSSVVVEWQRNYGGPLRDYLWATDTTANADLFVVGSRRFVEENVEWWAMRLTSLGYTVWARTWGSPFSDPISGMTTKSNGNVLFTSSWKYDQAATMTRAYMAELDQWNGEIMWEREYGPVLNLTILRVAKEVTPGGGHIAIGMAFAESSNFFQGLLLRTADNGDSLWMRRCFYYDDLMTDGMGELNDVVPTPDGGFIACGFTHGSYTGPYPPGYSQDVWVVKVDSLGCIVPGCDDFSTVITEQVTNLKDALVVYPNPAHGGTTVQVTLPQGSPFAQDLTLRLVSTQGQEVLVQRAMAGENELDVRSPESGVYYIHLTSRGTWLCGTRLVVE